MNEKICLITGATSGIGKATAIELAKRGFTIILPCRQIEKGKEVQETIKRDFPQALVHVFSCDLASLQSIRDFASTFRQQYSALHLLINNAGVFSMRREETVDGFEKTFATNHLGHFLLTLLVLDLLKKSAPTRIINVSSHMHYRGKMNFEDLQKNQKYNRVHAYNDSKLANVLFTMELAKRLEGTPITVNSLHPGVIATNIWPSNAWYLKLLIPLTKLFFRSPEQGAKTSLYLATSAEVEGVSGKYFDENQAEKHPSRQALEADIRERLWEVSEQLVGLKSPL
ncbi:MAG: SDR family oxidoreductase [Planctomycetota bacterium]